VEVAEGGKRKPLASTYEPSQNKEKQIREFIVNLKKYEDNT